jgi:hypothetical protein
MNFKKFIPHIIAVALFFSLASIYFYPAYQGYSLKQGDINNFLGMANEQITLRKLTGEETAWTNSMFGGMPTFQIGLFFSSNLLMHIDNLVKLYLPRGVDVAFLFGLCFYIFLLCIKTNPWVAIVGSLGFAFSTYLFIYLEAGHNSKVHAVAWMMPVLGSFYLIFKRNKIYLGASLLAVFLGIHLFANHYQMTYYLLFIVAFYLLYELVEHILSKQFKSLIHKSIITLIAVSFAILSNIDRLWTTYEYSKSTIRGKSELTINTNPNQKADGLSNDYITQWSYGIDETFSILIPNAKGGVSGAMLYPEFMKSFQGKPSEKREADKILNKVDKNLKNHVLQELQKGKTINSYWGNMPFTSGPFYVGATVFLLFILSFVIWQSKLKWYFLIAIILGFVLSWGKNFPTVTNWFIENFPMYNKFRAVSSLLFIPLVLIPFFAAMSLQSMFQNPECIQHKKKQIYIILGTTLGLFLIIILSPQSFITFLSDTEMNQFSGNIELKKIEQALIDYRISVFKDDAIRSFTYMLLVVASIYLLMINKINKNVFIALIGIFILSDLWNINVRYLNNEKEGREYKNWVKSDKKMTPYDVSNADYSIYEIEVQNPTLQQTIQTEIKKLGRLKADELKQKELALLNLNTNYRVYKLSGNAFQESGTSFFHKSIGGYHAAKLKKYQELIIDYGMEDQTKTLIQALNTNNINLLQDLNLLNMLNVKYFIYNENQPAFTNPFALGNAWFIDTLKIVQTADEEFNTTLNLNTSSNAVSAQKIYNQTTFFNNEGSIELKKYHPSNLTYEVTTNKKGFIVFSEIYYNPGWNAYVDGKIKEHFRVNYILRGMEIDEGKHTIEFKFEPKSYTLSKPISTASSLLIIIALLFFGYKEIKPLKNDQ